MRYDGGDSKQHEFGPRGVRAPPTYTTQRTSTHDPTRIPAVLTHTKSSLAVVLKDHKITLLRGPSSTLKPRCCTLIRPLSHQYGVQRVNGIIR